MLISLLIGLIVCALIYWVLQQLPLPPLAKTIATIVIVIAVVLWLVRLIPGGSSALV